MAPTLPSRVFRSATAPWVLTPERRRGFLFTVVTLVTLGLLAGSAVLVAAM